MCVVSNSGYVVWLKLFKMYVQGLDQEDGIDNEFEEDNIGDEIQEDNLNDEFQEEKHG